MAGTKIKFEASIIIL